MRFPIALVAISLFGWACESRTPPLAEAFPTEGVSKVTASVRGVT
jgi:hypothetical protein